MSADQPASESLSAASSESASDQTQQQVSPTNVRWLIFVLACGTSWFMYLHRYTWNFVGPLLKEQYGWTDAEMQWAYSLFNWTYGFGQIPSGVLCDFVGPHLFLGIIIITWSLVLSLYGVRMNFAALGGLRFLFGFAQAGGYPILAKVTQTWFPPAYRTQVQGCVATFFGRSGGAMSSILLATVLIGYCKLSWQMSLFVLSMAGVLFGILFLILFRNSPDIDARVNAAERTHINEGRTPPVAGERRILPWREAIKSRSMRCLVLQQVFVAGADTIFASLMGAYFLSKGVNIKEAGWAASLPLWGGAIGGVLGGLLNDSLIRGRRAWLVCVGGIAGAVLAAFVRATQTVLQIIGQPEEARIQAGGSLAQIGHGLIDVAGYCVVGGMAGALAICVLLPAAGSRRWARSSIACAGNLLASVLVLITIRQESVLATGLALFTVKYFADMCQPTQWGVCTDIGGRFSATVFGIVNTAGNIGGMIFPPIFGLILTFCTTRSIVNGVEKTVTDYNPMFLLIAAMYVTAALCWLLIDSTRTVEGQAEGRE